MFEEVLDDTKVDAKGTATTARRQGEFVDKPCHGERKEASNSLRPRAQ